MGRMGRATETRRLAKSLGEKPHGAGRTLPVQEWGQTDNPPQEQGGVFVGDPGGRELGSAELGAPNGLRQPQTDPYREAETYGYFPGLRVRVRQTPQLCNRRGRPCLSRRVGDLRYPPRPTHPGAPYSPARVRPRGGGCWGRGCALEIRGNAA